LTSRRRRSRRLMALVLRRQATTQAPTRPPTGPPAMPPKQFSTSSQITGKAFGTDHAAPTPVEMGDALNDFHDAYTEASSRPKNDAERQNINGGAIGGLTFSPASTRFRQPPAWPQTLPLRAVPTTSLSYRLGLPSIKPRTRMCYWRAAHRRRTSSGRSELLPTLAQVHQCRATYWAGRQ
jgi:hypothetical protein